MIFINKKKPDVILKLKRKFYIIEHKKVNSCGGHQDAQINELINFITLSHRDISFISFLSGEYFNKFRANSSKIKCQKKEILRNLHENSQNYFLNEEGFKKLVRELKS